MKEIKLIVVFISYPFIIGACFKFIGAWAGIPALLVFGLLWVGNISLIMKYTEEKKNAGP